VTIDSPKDDIKKYIINYLLLWPDKGGNNDDMINTKKKVFYDFAW
jgi:hypothetical protein